MNSRLITACLVVVGLINIAPVLGLISAGQMEAAYGIPLVGHDLEILMRHRALLFGILGGYVLYAAFSPLHQLTAMVMAGVSMLGFIALAYGVGAHNDALSKIVVMDIVGLVFLSVAVFLLMRKRRGQ